jgi:hypothetical protein
MYREKYVVYNLIYKIYQKRIKYIIAALIFIMSYQWEYIYIYVYHTLYFPLHKTVFGFHNGPKNHSVLYTSASYTRGRNYENEVLINVRNLVMNISFYFFIM